MDFIYIVVLTHATARNSESRSRTTSRLRQEDPLLRQVPQWIRLPGWISLGTWRTPYFHRILSPLLRSRSLTSVITLSTSGHLIVCSSSCNACGTSRHISTDHPTRSTFRPMNPFSNRLPLNIPSLAMPSSRLPLYHVAYPPPVPCQYFADTPQKPSDPVELISRW